MHSTRRGFLATGATVASAALASQALADWEPSPRYPDPRVRILDPSFARYRLSLAKVERLGTGFRWCEGPAWFGDGRFLLWSDIPNNRILKWEEETGAISLFRKPSNNANGNTRDRRGRLVTCEHDARRVTRTEHDGTITVVAEAFDGRPLNSPNDVVCKSDGSIFFTDPSLRVPFAEREVPNAGVYRIAPDGALSLVADASPEPHETFEVTLSAPTGGAALGAPSVATVTILDDATASPPSWSAVGRLGSRREFHTATEGIAIDRRDRRHVQGIQARKHRLTEGRIPPLLDEAAAG